MRDHRTDLSIVLGAVLVSILAIPLGGTALSARTTAVPSAAASPWLASTPPTTCGDPASCPSTTSVTSGGGALLPEIQTAASTPLAWSEILPTAPLGTLGSGAGMVADPVSGSAIVFGGASSEGLSNVTLSYSEATNAWSNVSTANAPSPRAYFAFGFDPPTGEAVLFGGLLNATSESDSSATWAYDVASATWTNVSRPGPAPRELPAFAVDPALGIGLLYGGENLNYQSVGTITFSDLWELNLSTFGWTRINVTSGALPPPLEGAAMTWDPSTGEFQMFGGCAPCSNAVWEFDPVSETWSELAVRPTSPMPASGSSWTYDPLLGADVLFGGYDGLTANNGTTIFYPGNDTWVPQAGPGPSARWSAASAYLSVAGNATWLVAGGAAATGPLFDLWRLSLTSNLALRVENASAPNLPIDGAAVSVNGRALGFTDPGGSLNLTRINGVDSQLRVAAYGSFTNTSTLWLPPGSSDQVVVLLTAVPPQELGTIHVSVAAAQGVPVVGAAVNLTVNGFRDPSSPETTGALGVVTFIRVPPGPFNLSVLAGGWRSNSTTGNLTEGALLNTTIGLSADPTLFVTAWGQLPSGASTRLGGVTVSLDGVPIGITGARGTLRRSTAALGEASVTGNAPGYTPAIALVSVPWTGEVNATLVLVSLPTGGMEVLVLDQSTDGPLYGAQVVVDSYGPLPSGWSNTTLYTGGTGWANDSSLLQGYYEVSANAAGYAAPSPVIEHVVSSEYVAVTIRLVPIPVRHVALYVQSSATQLPVRGARVAVSNLMSGYTTSFGYFNLSDFRAGSYLVVVSATGYRSNSTTLTFYPFENKTLAINLTPLTAGGPPPGPSFSLLPAGAPWEALLLVPAVLAVGGVLYATAARSAPSDEGQGGNRFAPERVDTHAPPPGSRT